MGPTSHKLEGLGDKLLRILFGHREGPCALLGLVRFWGDICRVDWTGACGEEGEVGQESLTLPALVLGSRLPTLYCRQHSHNYISHPPPRPASGPMRATAP